MKFHTSLKVFLILIPALSCLTASAQYTVIANAIKKLNDATNLSYHSNYSMKDRFSDTLKMQQDVLLMKVEKDIELGYYGRNNYTYGPKKTPFEDLYNGKNVMRLNPIDTTYTESSTQNQLFNGSLLGELVWIKDLMQDSSTSGITELTDTVFNSRRNYHYLLKVKDTTINNDRIYIYKHLLIDRLTGLPTAILTRSRSGGYGKELINRYIEQVYSAFHINSPDLTIADFDTPAGYHIKEGQEDKAALLKPGSLAPDWTLVDLDNKKISLSQLKGSVVLLDFFYVGCIPCMDALPLLDILQKKYKDTNFILLSISLRDDQKVLKAFRTSQQIHNKLYPEGKDVATLYHVMAAPTYYLIDQSGFITKNWEGNPGNFESNLSSLIDELLK